MENIKILETKREKRKLLVRSFKDKFFQVILFFFSIPLSIPLFSIIYNIFKNGIKALNINFFTQLPNYFGDGGGIIHAITGTLLLIIIASLISLPISLLTGIYLSENKNKKLAKITKFIINLIQGIPSIIIGIVTYELICKTFKGYSAFAGGFALSLIMIPLMTKQTDEILSLIPETYKEASISLGVSYKKTILKVIVPAGLEGIKAGFLTSVARIAGESAPLLFTAFGNFFVNLNPFKPVHALPLLIYNYAMSPYDNLKRIGWGASLVLIIIIFIFKIISKIGQNKHNI
ncbi:MAG: phosphate ABC transporter permease PstA [Spirochaetes bacterium]|nr:phosphate ABC transporter permease PstA [Spirochaetota bacterium]